MAVHPENSANSSVSKAISIAEPTIAFFQDMLDQLNAPIYAHNQRNQFVFANLAFKKLIDNHDLIGKTIANVLTPEQEQLFLERDDLANGDPISTLLNEQFNGSCHSLIKKTPISLPNGSAGQMGIIHDVSEFQIALVAIANSQKVKLRTHIDPLTGLANRRRLQEYFATKLKSRFTAENNIGVLVIDLDNLMLINKEKGFEFGDAVIKHLASTIQHCVQEEDFTARFGKDEFIILSFERDLTQLQALAQCIVDSAGTMLELDKENHSSSVSVGVSFDSTCRMSLNQMLKYAHLALRSAKRNGRGRFEQYTEKIEIEYNEFHRQRDDFRIALKEGQIIPFYQPQFNAQTLGINGVEALARWDHPTRGVIEPAEFLEIVQSGGYFEELDQLVLKQAMVDLKELMNLFDYVPALTINVSHQSMSTNRFIETIKTMQPFPNRISCEVAESTLLGENKGQIGENFTALREMGVSIDIDDFGSSQSSFLAALEAKPNRVKIDRRLVIPMTKSDMHYKMVRSIIQVATSMGVETVAKGVKSEAHRKMLLDLGCDSIQGFGFAQPMPFSKFKRLLEIQAAA